MTGPAEVNWDITYACPLRCAHCYSESGRRPSRQLGADDMLRVAGAIADLRPRWVALSGGEPLSVRGILPVARRIAAAGIPVSLYTSGWTLRPDKVDDLLDTFARINVSVDAANPLAHDRIRGRAGSFDRAMHTLALLDDAVGRRVAAGLPPVEFGIDCTVVRSSLPDLDDLCTTVAPRFPRLSFVWIAAAMPIGLASRAGFADHELLTDEQADDLAGAANRERMLALAPAGVALSIVDSRTLTLDPELRGQAPYMQVEPDGAVRAFPIYEGTVGSLLDEPGNVLWERGLARWRDPFVERTLGAVRGMRDWADATRLIDRHFGSDDVRDRLDRRPDLPAPLVTAERR